MNTSYENFVTLCSNRWIKIDVTARQKNAFPQCTGYPNWLVTVVSKYGAAIDSVHGNTTICKQRWPWAFFFFAFPLRASLDKTGGPVKCGRPDAIFSRSQPLTLSLPRVINVKISPAASPIIVHHPVRRTWLFVPYSDERWLHYQFSLPHLYIFSLKGSENVLFESSGVKGSIVRWEISLDQSALSCQTLSLNTWKRLPVNGQRCLANGRIFWSISWNISWNIYWNDFIVISPGTSGKPGTVAGDEGSLVGEVDGQGFGVGVAPSGVKPNVTTLVGTRKVKSRSKGKDSARLKSAGQNEGPGDEQAQSSSSSAGQRSSTPPLKEEAFEEFKQERGSEINRILNENKGGHKAWSPVSNQ